MHKKETPRQRITNGHSRWNVRLIGPKTEALTILRILEIYGVRGIINFSWMIFMFVDDAVENLTYYCVLYIDTKRDCC